MVQSYPPLGSVGFIGMQSGGLFTFPPDEAFNNIGSMLGWLHFGPQHVGSDILPLMADADGVIGFAPPLPGPSYTFWIQQTETSVTYALDFIVEAIPEPSSIVLVCSIGTVLFVRRPRQRRSMDERR